MAFGERLKQALEQKDITQKKFAIKMNVSESAISDYVNNRRLPNIILIEDFAKELGVSVDYLLDYHPNPDSVALSPDEAELIKALRTLPKDKRDVLVTLIEMLAEN